MHCHEELSSLHISIPTIFIPPFILQGMSSIPDIEKKKRKSNFQIEKYFFPFFAALDPKTKQCPHLGSYKVASWRSYHSVEGTKEMVGFDGEHTLDGSEDDAVAQEVRVTPLPPPSTTPCHQDSVTGLDMGCRSSHRIEFSASCTDEAFSGKTCFKISSLKHRSFIHRS